MTPGKYQDWAALVGKLSKAFDPPNQEEAQCAILRTRAWKKDEMPQEFGYSLSVLARQAYPLLGEDACETIALDHFMQAQSDGEFRMMVLIQSPQTVKEAANLFFMSLFPPLGHYMKNSK